MNVRRLIYAMHMPSAVVLFPSRLQRAVRYRRRYHTLLSLLYLTGASDDKTY